MKRRPGGSDPPVCRRIGRPALAAQVLAPAIDLVVLAQCAGVEVRGDDLRDLAGKRHRSRLPDNLRALADPELAILVTARAQDRAHRGKRARVMSAEREPRHQRDSFDAQRCRDAVTSGRAELALMAIAPALDSLVRVSNTQMIDVVLLAEHVVADPELGDVCQLIGGLPELDQRPAPPPPAVRSATDQHAAASRGRHRHLLDVGGGGSWQLRQGLRPA